MFATPLELRSSVQRFKQDFPPGKWTAFLAMRFAPTRTNEAILRGVRKACIEFDITALRADQKAYSEDLYSNVITYLYACELFICVFDLIDNSEHNPNVALELGAAQMLRKPTLILRSSAIKPLPTDIVGRLYREFAADDPEASIESQVRDWLTQQNFPSHPSTLEKLRDNQIDGSNLETYLCHYFGLTPNNFRDTDAYNHRIAMLHSKGYSLVGELHALLERTELARAFVRKQEPVVCSVCELGHALMIEHEDFEVWPHSRHTRDALREACRVARSMYYTKDA